MEMYHFRYGRTVTLSIRYVMLASLAVSTIVIIFTGCTFLSVSTIIYFS